MTRLRVAIVGAGKIARDQHAPAICAHPALELACVIDPHQAPAIDGAIDEARGYGTLDEALKAGERLDIAAICTPPQVRARLAHAALDAGLHVLLEKPPAASASQAAALAAHAAKAQRTIFAAWHSRFARGVAPARDWLRAHPPARIAVIWREDVRVWHPGQDWLWRPGGLGVFDPGVNALSILTAVLDHSLAIESAELVYGPGQDAPVAAGLSLSLAQGNTAVPVEAVFDFRTPPDQQTWTIQIDTHDGARLTLTDGGERLVIDKQPVSIADTPEEYAGVYAHLLNLIDAGTSDLDARPLILVGDAFLVGARTPELSPAFAALGRAHA